MAVEFCQRLSDKRGEKYRLPSEAEWEYACRAGTTTPFYFGKTISTNLANYHGRYNYGDGNRGEFRGKTTPVGTFPRNLFGIFDMHGNVWEWCEDVWHENYEEAPTDGSAWLIGGEPNRRIVRGGSYILNPGFCRSAHRFGKKPDEIGFFNGFRIASTINLYSTL